jgi:MFS family permease
VVAALDLLQNLGAEEAAKVRGRLRATTAAEDLAGADVIVEALVEKLDLKRKVLAEAAAVAPRALLASNTSALSVAFLGNTVLQIPIGWLSDRSSRRQVMVLCAVLTALGALLLPGLPDRLPLFLGVLFVFGATAGGLYTMAMSELGDRFSGSDLVAGNAAFAIAFGMGGMIGGPITGAAMQLTGNGGFAGVLALIFTAMAALAYLRRRRG